MAYRIGFIGIVSDELKRDLLGTLQHMAALGYQGLESPRVDRSDVAAMVDFKSRLDALGLGVPAIGASGNTAESIAVDIRAAHALGSQNIVCYWSAPQTREEVMQQAETMEALAVTAAAEGINFCYHNHEHEFVPRFGGKGQESIFDLYYQHTEKLCFELDIAWCHFAGCDPVRLIRRCGQRIPILHVKDLADNRLRGHFCALGLGVVPCFAAMEAAAAKGCTWMVVEQDKPGRLTPLESAAASMYNIREAGLYPVRP